MEGPSVTPYPVIVFRVVEEGDNDWGRVVKYKIKKNNYTNFETK